MLAGKGWGLGATMHADSLDEAIASFRSSLGATDPDIAGLTIYLQYSAYLTPTGMYRRVEEAWHLRLDELGALAPVRLGAIAGGRSPRMTGAQRLPAPPMLSSDAGRSTQPFEHDPAAYAVLATSLGLTADALEAEISDRATFLGELAERGICDPPAVAAAVASYGPGPVVAPAPDTSDAEPSNG